MSEEYSQRLITVALGLGSNLGRRRETLLQAIDALANVLANLKVAQFYLNSPISPVPQGWFVNTAVVGRTTLAADQVLALGKALELEAGRDRNVRHGPRPLDIDLLVYGDLTLTLPELTVPHPQLATRRFVLKPLVEIAPDLQIPPSDVTVEQLYAAIGETPDSPS